MQIYSDNAELWYAKADAEYNLGRLQNSIESYWRVIKTDPHNYHAMLDLSNTLIENEEYDRAENALNILLDKKPGWSEVYYSKAKLHFLRGEIEYGMNMIEKAFEVNPEDRFDYDFEKDWEKILHFLLDRQN